MLRQRIKSFNSDHTSVVHKIIKNHPTNHHNRPAAAAVRSAVVPLRLLNAFDCQALREHEMCVCAFRLVY